MRHWQDETDREYGLPTPVKPAGFRDWQRPPALLFLDLNHWILLARAKSGRGDPPYVELLTVLGEALADGRVKVVLTGALYREVSKIAHPRQRNDLAALMQELSGPSYLPGPVDVLRAEIVAALDVTTGSSGTQFEPTDIVGGSALNIVGAVGGLRITDADGEDVTNEFVAVPSQAAALAAAEREAERMFLAGPADHEVEALRANGYRPEVPRQMVRDNAEFEAAWSERLAPFRSQGRIRDFLIFRHLQLELIAVLLSELSVRGLTIEAIAGSPETIRRFVMSMPSSAVTVSMLAHYHHDPQKRWSENDIYDIGSLALAVPFCDVVFTDAAARNALRLRHIDEWLGTVIPRGVADLIKVLEELPMTPSTG
ncbi:hypothetical protein [Curtobacterium sp. NPDC086286]|uniref:hypothetical protein n=1 Tax=Curtobacterium sp. NPDC086286 TaxID=3363964 RepID=UPI0038263486